MRLVWGEDDEDSYLTIDVHDVWYGDEKMEGQAKYRQRVGKDFVELDYGARSRVCRLA